MSTPAGRLLFVAIIYTTTCCRTTCEYNTVNYYLQYKGVARNLRRSIMASHAVRYDAHRCGVVPDVGVRSMKSSLEMKAREQRPQKSAFLDLSEEVTS